MTDAHASRHPPRCRACGRRHAWRRPACTPRAHRWAPSARLGAASTRLALAVLAGLSFTACGSDVPGSERGDTIDTETFVQTMVDLRAQAYTRPGNELAPGDADRILDARGVAADDLRRFVEVHGRNLPLMNSIWVEVERRLEEELDASRADD